MIDKSRPGTSSPSAPPRQIRWTLRRKLTGGFFIVAALVSGLAMLTAALTARTSSQVTVAQETGVAPAFVAEDLKLDVVQVQQWLTDISATRGAPGFDDGFDEAAAHADAFREGAGKLAEMRPDLTVRLEDILETFEEYYAQGVEMASVYVAEGPDAGNLMMEQFDAIAGEMSEAIDTLTAEMLVGADEALAKAVSGAADTRKLLMFASIAIFATAMAIGSWMAHRIATRVNKARDLGRRIARGDTTTAIDFTDGGDEIDELIESMAATTSYLQEASSVVEQIAYGDLSAGFTPRSENDTMGHAVSEMVESLRTVLSEAAEVTDQVKAGSEILASSSDESARSATEVATSIGGVADNATAQATIAEEFARALQEIAADLEATTSAVADVTEASSQADSVAAEGLTQIELVRAAMGEITSSFGHVAGNIGELDQHSENVEEIVDLIRSIAEQTNLLALNAAIEAARAGEMGRGFAVVASEVKALAEEAAKSTEDIADIVSQMRDSVALTKDAMATGKDQLGRGNDVVETTGAAFGEIAAAMRNMRDKVDAVSGATQRIRGAVTTIEAGTANLSQATESNSIASEQVAAASQQAAATSEEIGATAQELADGSARLAASISHFTVDGRLHMTGDRDFKMAKAAHRAWAGRLRSFIFGSDIDVDEQESGSADSCQLGKWLYGPEGAAHAGLSEFIALEKAHAEFHRHIGDAVRAKTAGDYAAAHAIVDEIDDMSGTIVAMLQDLERRLLSPGRR